MFDYNNVKVQYIFEPEITEIELKAEARNGRHLTVACQMQSKKVAVKTSADYQNFTIFCVGTTLAAALHSMPTRLFSCGGAVLKQTWCSVRVYVQSPARVSCLGARVVCFTVD